MNDRKEKLFFVGVKALIQNSAGEILILLADVANHRMNIEPYWDIPGGRIEHGDSEQDTLSKELYEETGIKLKTSGELISTVISNHNIPLYEGGEAGLLLRVWRVPFDETMTVILSDEHSEFAWVSPQEAAKRLTHKYPSDFCEIVANM